MKSSYDRFQVWLGEWNEAKTRQTLIVVLAVLVGVLIGMVLDTALRSIGDYIFPPPPILDIADKEQLRELLKTWPESYFIKIISWAVGTLGGGYAAVRIAKMGQFPAWIVGIMLFAGYLIDLVRLPNPLWVMLLCPVLVGLCAWGSGWLGMYMNYKRGVLRNEAEAEAEI